MTEPKKCAIPCDTCRDLIPLVLDGAASESSRALVEEHIAHCEGCRAFYGEGAPIPEPNDEKVLGRMRRYVLLWLITLAGLLLCTLLMAGGPRQGRFVIPVLAALGALARWWGGRRWYLLPGGMGAFACVWYGLRSVPAGQSELSAWIWQALAFAVLAGVAAALLGLLGGAAAALLRYAFAKEDAP